MKFSVANSCTLRKLNVLLQFDLRFSEVLIVWWNDAREPMDLKEWKQYCDSMLKPDIPVIFWIEDTKHLKVQEQLQMF